MSPRDRDVIIHDGSIKLQGWSYSGGGIGSKELRSVPMGRSFQRSLRKHEIQPDDRGHVWYACAPEDMTEKVSPEFQPPKFTA